MQNTELKEALGCFSLRFHRNASILEADKSNYISSPLGAWILLAQVAGGNHAALTREEAEKIENALGLNIPAAYNYANFLIRAAPPAIKAASAAWFSSSWPVGEIGATWIVNTEQEEATTVARMIPSKTELDKWASENTLGIIEEFPFTPDSATVMILANALATRIQWAEPFTEVEAKPDSTWKAEKLLFSDFDQHNKHLFTDDDGNLFAVLTAKGSGLSVHAVIADDSNISAEKVLEVAESYAAGNVFALVSPDTLPVNGNIFTITNTTSSVGDLFSATLPAWEATKEHDLADLGLPYIEAAKAISNDVNYKTEAVQIAKAKFSRVGFEAAAVSVQLMVATGVPRHISVKRVDIDFKHPFAVVAANSPAYNSAKDAAALWDSLPVFSAWVTDSSATDN
jgi:hypothetical protein